MKKHNIDEMDFSPDEGSFIINLDKVSKVKNFSKITRTLAIDLQETPYFSIGTYFKSLSDKDVQELVELCERDDDDAVGELLLLSEMLSRAEGITSEDFGEYGEKVGILRMLSAGVSLHRKGLLKAHYDNMTLDVHNYGNKVLFEKLF